MERAEYGAGDSADWTTIAAHEAFGAEDKLPELGAACPEEAGAAQKIVAEHAGYPFLTAEAALFAAAPKVPGPGHERSVIVRAKVVPVFHDETPGDRRAHV